MNLPAYKPRAFVAVALSCALCFLGLPAAPLFADETDDAASSSEVAEQPAAAEKPEGTDDATPDDAGNAPASGSDEPGETPSKPSEQPASSADPTSDGKGASSDATDKDADAAKDADADKEADKDDDKEKDDADADKEKEDDEEAKAKAKEKAAAAAEEAFEQAKAEAASAQARLAELPGLQAQLEPYPGMLADAWARLQEADAARKPLTDERQSYFDEQALLREEREAIIHDRETADERRAKALYGLMLVDEELSRTGGVDLVSLIVGTSNATEAESYGYMLEKVAECIAGRVMSASEDRLSGSSKVDEVNERIAAVAEKIEVVNEQLAATDEEHTALTAEVARIIEEGNAVAYAMERICSEARQGTQDASTKVLALSGVDTTPNTTSAKAAKAAEEAAKAAEEAAKAAEGSSSSSSAKKDEEEAVIPDNVADFVKESESWDVKDHELRVAAQNAVGAWYDAVDVLGGAEGYISYGMGIDFALDEDAFVEKWAAAINEFYIAKGSPPLGGYGEEIARQAYAYHVDPRLCAAVSINESGGGAVCIRPHNAWGWGAADSDPYNLASEWSSWEVAIESWHRGMATNPYGLATSSSVSRLSDIYCGTPIWAQRAVDSMEQMYQIAKAQQEGQDGESVAVTAAATRGQGDADSTDAGSEGSEGSEAGTEDAA